MYRHFLLAAFIAAFAGMSACTDDQPNSPGEQEFRAVVTTVQSRSVAIPVTFTTPIVEGGDTYPLVVMAHGHGGSREEGGGYRAVAESLAMRGIASIRMDFPGCGDSTESFTENNLSNMLLDLQAARDFAVNDAGVDEQRLGLLGFSMGGRLVALLSEIDTRYKAMVVWAPAVANGADREHESLGGPDVYSTLRKKAQDTGKAEYTTTYGQDLVLGFRWFTDLEETMPLDALAKFRGPFLVVYGDQDEAVPPAISEAAIEAAEKSSEVIRHVINGVGHDLGFYSDLPEVAAEVVDQTVVFLSKRL